MAYPVLCAVVVVTSGQPYYTTGLVLALFAAGSIPTVPVGIVGPVPATTRARAAFGAPRCSDPLGSGCPSGAAGDHARDDSDRGHQPGNQRPDRLADVRAAGRRGPPQLPPDQAARAVIITANYGEAGALDRFGADYTLPPVFSGHNELWFRGQPPDDADVVIAVGFSVASLEGDFDSCRFAVQLDNGVDIPNEEQQRSVLVCRGPTRAWDDLWPTLQHYD